VALVYLTSERPAAAVRIGSLSAERTTEEALLRYWRYDMPARR
jgi:hypothetical protein